MVAKTIAGFLVLAASLTVVCQAVRQIGCNLETLRKCGDDYIPYGNYVAYPTTGKGLENKCKEEMRQMACTVRYVDDCLEGLPQTALLRSLKELQETFGGICTIGSELYKQYQKILPCMNSAGSEINTCFQNLKSSLQRAVVKAPVKEVVPHTCCAYADLVECIDTALAPCEAVGTKDFFLGLMNRVLGMTLKTVCIDHNKGSEACKALPKLPLLSSKDRKVDNYLELIIEAAFTLESHD